MESEANPPTEQIAFLSHQLQGVRDRLLLKITPSRTSRYSRHGKSNAGELDVMRTNAVGLRSTSQVCCVFGLIGEAKDGRLQHAAQSAVTGGVKLVLKTITIPNFGFGASEEHQREMKVHQGRKKVLYEQLHK